MCLERSGLAGLGVPAVAVSVLVLFVAACRTTAGPRPVDSPRPPLAQASEATPPATGASTEETSAAEPPDGATTADAEKSWSNTIRWKTASELDNFGYDVYRGESPEGPFERITVEVVEGAGTTDEPTAYRYVDRDIDPHKTYFYYVESISMNGDRERFTPIGRAAPKIARESGGDEGDRDEP